MLPSMIRSCQAKIDEGGHRVTPSQEETPVEPAEVYYLSQGESFQWYGEEAWVSGYDTTVDLVIKGPRNELHKLDRSKIRIVANTSNIKEAGSQTLTYEVVFPDNIRRGKLTVDSASIYSITVTVGELDSKEVPISVKLWAAWLTATWPGS